MPEGLLAEFDQWVDASGFANRSVALRHLVRKYVSGESWSQGSGNVCGTITMLYDHHSNDVTAELTALQHDFGGQIICTTHVHVTHELCMEGLFVTGSVEQLKKLEEALSSLKGIQSVNVAIFKLI